jgi:C-terminal processing protease CtpA/Prc
MSLTPTDRIKILDEVNKFVLAKHFNVKSPLQDYSQWKCLAQEQAPKLTHATTDEEFERGVRALLAALESSHTAFTRQKANDMPAQHAINATVSPIQTERGEAWMFVDVIEDGMADQAGIKPGEILAAIDGVRIAPPQTPKFTLGHRHRLTVIHGSERTVDVEVPNRTAKDRPPLIEPRSFTYRMFTPEIGLLKVASFPGTIGNEFAKALDAAMTDLKQQGCHKLIVDFRGNVGGGLGSLRLMSYLCADQRPIGHSLTRHRFTKGYDKHRLTRIGKIPSGKWELLRMALKFRYLHKDRSMVLVTEGLGPQPFHGQMVILINEHTHSAAEMVASFATENKLATLVGTTTAGQVLGGANFKLHGGYTLRMPVAGWYTWNEQCIEGRGVSPDIEVFVTQRDLLKGRDAQMSQARDLLEQRQAISAGQTFRIG